ncbi:MAG: hypothetical protein U0270_34935 [Labilithrix sp.]
MALEQRGRRRLRRAMDDPAAGVEDGADALRPASEPKAVLEMQREPDQRRAS